MSGVLSKDKYAAASEVSRQTNHNATAQGKKGKKGKKRGSYSKFTLSQYNEAITLLFGVYYDQQKLGKEPPEGKKKLSYRDIHKKTTVPRSTLQRWFKDGVVDTILDGADEAAETIAPTIRARFTTYMTRAEDAAFANYLGDIQATSYAHCLRVCVLGAVDVCPPRAFLTSW